MIRFLAHSKLITALMLLVTTVTLAQEEVFKVVETMPRFPGCEDMQGTEREKEICAQEKLLQYIYKNLEYPNIARENGIEGMCVLQFIVDTDGSITDIEIVRDIGQGCCTNAQQVIESMNQLPEKWTPGTQRGSPVKVLYTFPVRFKLDKTKGELRREKRKAKKAAKLGY